jgi:cellulose synthase/poly-beta-1,6-N-acetylglucosamine synthase-like glycosyltransferase
VRFKSPALLVLLICAILCSLPQLIGNWILYFLANDKPVPALQAETPSVDIFITIYHEPAELVERALSAARTIHLPHQTWLLDDGHDPAMKELALKYGAGYLERGDNRDRKAGNINAALQKTTGEIIAIFDVDHTPLSNFLEHTLPFFQDESIGFVQVMLTFKENKGHWITKAAIESSLDYYNPTQVGADQLGGASHTGSNGLIRRSALEAIGGYKPGLAEDLATSLALHAAGYRSAYLREPLAPGLTPPDPEAWFIQQLKWARGVFELLLTDFPKQFKKLTWGQRIAYSVRLTNYWIGPVILAHLMFAILALFSKSPAMVSQFNDYLLHLAPLMVIAIIIRFLALYYVAPTGNRFVWRGIALVYFTWPVYSLAWIMALLRIPLKFQPTPKSPSERIHMVWLLPQVMAAGSLIAGVVYALLTLNGLPVPVILFCLLQLGLLFLASPILRSKNSTGESL